MKIRRSALPLCLAAFLFLLGPWLRPAIAQLLGPEFQVNSYTTSGQSQPAVAADGSGNLVVVWQSYGQDGWGWGIFGQRLDSVGSPLGNEFRVNSYTTNAQSRAAVTADGPGNFLVVWQSIQDGSGYGVFGQRFDSTGSPVGSEFQVNSYTTSDQSGPAVAADGSGNFVVVWTSGDFSSGQDGSMFGVFGQGFNSAGSPVGSEFQANTFTTSSQRFPAVAADGSGNFVVAWGSDVQDGSGYAVFGQRVSAAGSKVGNEFQVSTYTTSFQRSPAMAADGSGNVVIVWESYLQDGSEWGVFGQRYDSTGSRVGSEFQVNTYAMGRQEDPAVAADGSGNFVVTWSSDVQDGSSDGVFRQRFDSTGNKVGSEFQVNSYTTSSQRFPAVAADGSGNFVVAWGSDVQDGSGFGVFGQRLAGPMFSDGFEAGDACGWSAAVGGGCP